jgi:hypothetical protein
MSKKRWLIIVVIVVAAIALAILLDALLANHRPAITSLEAEPEKVIPWGSCQIACNASDADDDQLSYNWSASGGEINGEGATVIWTAPGSEGSYNVTVTVTDGRGGEVTNYVAIEVRDNSPPTITSLVADAAWTTPSGSIQLTCTASDPDEDVLSYGWTTDGGDISGTGMAVNWTAPQEVGIYDVTVVVKDGYGGEDRGMLSLSVNLGTPPDIEKLCVTPEGHKYLRGCTAAGCDYDVWKNEDYDIECVASGTGELVYEWSCDDGQISEVSEDGATITWTAPSTTGEVTVTVIVSDTAGNSVGKNIDVASCTCGSWGLELGCK